MLPENLALKQHPTSPRRTPPIVPPELSSVDRKAQRSDARYITEHDGRSACQPKVRPERDTEVATGMEDAGRHESLPVIHPPAEVMDAIAELIVLAPGSTERASVIAALVDELSALVGWCQGDPADAAELAGVRGIVTAAQEHRAEMQFRTRPTTSTTG